MTTSYIIQVMDAKNTVLSSVDCQPPTPCTERLWVAKAMREALDIKHAPDFAGQYVRVMTKEGLLTWRTY